MDAWTFPVVVHAPCTLGSLHTMHPGERPEVVALVRDSLRSTPWVTVVGAPGSGKTTVARAVAHGQDAVWVSARGEDEERITDLILDAIGIQRTPGETAEESLVRALSDRDVLVVVDGLATFLPGVAEAVTRILGACPGVRLLVTSTDAAGATTECVVRLRPLALPKSEAHLSGPAYELLMARIRRAGGEEPGPDEARRVRELLEATGGLPLLIELLAVQIAAVGLENVAPLTQVTDSLQAAYDLLSPRAQLGYRRLAQMVAPVSLDVLADVVGLPRAEVAEIAMTLVSRSLAEVTQARQFDMLAPIRRHGRAIASTSPSDVVEARRGLVRWAERVMALGDDRGAADEPWLADLATMKSVILTAAAEADTLPAAYSLANRSFSPLYTAMLARDAADILEGVVLCGDGPPEIGAQVARRAAITVCELRGSFAGLPLLDNAESQAVRSSDPDAERARNGSIRSEMFLDAGDLEAARKEATLALEIGAADSYLVRQTRRTLADIAVSRGRFAESEALCAQIITGASPEELWMALSAQILRGRMAFERGRVLEAQALARTAYDMGREAAEDRMALIAACLLRLTGARVDEATPARDSLPWALRVPVMLLDARDLWRAGHARLAGQHAADLVALAQGSQLGRDLIDARLLLGGILVDLGDESQALSVFLVALEESVARGMPLRAADALDALAYLGSRRSIPGVEQWWGAAAEVRSSRAAVAWGGAARFRAGVSVRGCPEGWIRHGEVMNACLDVVRGAVVGSVDGKAAPVPPNPGTGWLLETLTKAELTVADLVAEGLTSRQIAERLFISPRTVDAHLAHTFRKLGITGRARLAALMAEARGSHPGG